MQLDSTQKIEAKIATAHTTTAPTFLASYADVDATTFALVNLPASNPGTLSTSYATLAAAPSAGRVRRVSSIAIWNADTVACVVTITLDTSASDSETKVVTLEAGDHLSYDASGGWSVLTKDGALREVSVTVSGGGDVWGPLNFVSTNVTTVSVLVSNSTYALLLDKPARASYSSISVRLQITTALVTTTWAEVAIYRGPLVLGGNSALERLGSLDVATPWGSTGQKTHIVPVTGVRPGDHLWVVLGSQAATPAQVRAGLADTIDAGLFGAAAATRPSTAATLTSTRSSTLAVPWVVAQGLV